MHPARALASTGAKYSGEYGDLRLLASACRIPSSTDLRCAMLTTGPMVTVGFVRIADHNFAERRRDRIRSRLRHARPEPAPGGLLCTFGQSSRSSRAPPRARRSRTMANPAPHLGPSSAAFRLSASIFTRTPSRMLCRICLPVAADPVNATTIAESKMRQQIVRRAAENRQRCPAEGLPLR